MKLKLIYLLITVHSTSAIWWWFFSNEKSINDESSNENLITNTKVDNAALQMFAPFEISVVEQKFLAEAQYYLQNLPMLDQCNLLIVNRLKASCSQLSDEDLSKLSVNLLNCQSAVEGRKLYKCTEDMALADCTKAMDSDTWNSYHIISNRARAICHSVRQAEFRMKTEQTVNRLATSTLENVNMLKQLASGQKELQDVTDIAIDKITSSQKEVLSKQDEFKERQAALSDVMEDNMKSLIHEKQIISQRHRQVEEYTQMINYQLAALVKEIKSQELSKKQSEQELLKDLDTVKEKADEVLYKLETAFVDMDTYHENVESKQNKTLQNLEEIQEAIAFMSNILTRISTSVHDQLPWLKDMLGDTMDKLSALTVILGHAVFFVASFFAVLFLNAPSASRVVLLIVVPLNCLAAIQCYHSLPYQQLAWLLFLTIPVNFMVKKIWHFKNLFHNRNNRHIVVGRNFSQDHITRDLLIDYKTSVFDPNNFLAADKYNDVRSMHILNQNVKSSTPQKQTPSDASPLASQNTSTHMQDSPRSHKTPPLKRRSMHGHSFITTPGLDTTIGGSVKCTSYTKNGTKCRNAATNCATTCRVHTPQKI